MARRGEALNGRVITCSTCPCGSGYGPDDLVHFVVVFLRHGPNCTLRIGTWNNREFCVSNPGGHDDREPLCCMAEILAHFSERLKLEHGLALKLPPGADLSGIHEGRSLAVR